MNILKILGVILVVSPFIVLFIITLREGWDCVLLVWGLTFTVVFVVALGTYLFTSF